MEKILLILLLYPICSFAQGVDSTSSYCSPIWRIWKIVHMAQQAAPCDSLVKYQEREINRGIREQQSAEDLLRIRTQELRLARIESDTLRIALKKGDQITVASVAEMKQKRNRWEGTAIGATAGGVAFGPLGAGVGAVAGYLIGSSIKPKTRGPNGKPP